MAAAMQANDSSPFLVLLKIISMENEKGKRITIFENQIDFVPEQ